MARAPRPLMTRLEHSQSGHSEGLPKIVRVRSNDHITSLGTKLESRVPRLSNDVSERKCRQVAEQAQHGFDMPVFTSYRNRHPLIPPR